VSAPVLTLRLQRCLNHPQREASARCPSCRQYYCRECITEHDDRVLCASCLAKLTLKKSIRRAHWSWIPRIVLALVAAGVVFMALLLIGDLFLSIPAQFHSAGGW
jgi:hypothetical protein